MTCFGFHTGTMKHGVTVRPPGVRVLTVVDWRGAALMVLSVCDGGSAVCAVSAEVMFL